MTETYVSYAPGSWTLVARAGRYLLVDATPADAAVGQLWATLESAGDLAEVLRTLAAVLPGAGYCLIGVTADGVQLAQSGVGAVLDGRALGVGNDPTPVAVPAVGGMLVASTAPGAAHLQIPIEGGVVGAGALIVVQVGAAAEPEPEPEPQPEPQPEPEPEPDEEADFASVLASLPPPTGDPVRPTEPPAASTQFWDDVPELAPEEVADPVADPTAPIQAPPPRPDQRGDTALPGDGGSGETVLAGICLNGHLSPAHAPSCRVCGSAMPPQSPRTIARPSLGVLVLQDGTTVDLDRGAILGRAPRVPDEATERPHLINLAAYGRDVSRQHAEVIVQGWSVFVRDLGSANGTRIHDQFGLVTLLQTGEAVPLPPESVIDIAEVTTIQYRTA